MHIRVDENRGARYLKEQVKKKLRGHGAVNYHGRYSFFLSFVHTTQVVHNFFKDQCLVYDDLVRPHPKCAVLVAALTMVNFGYFLLLLINLPTSLQPFEN